MSESTTTRLSQRTIRQHASLGERAVVVVPSEAVLLVVFAAWYVLVPSFTSLSLKVVIKKVKLVK